MANTDVVIDIVKGQGPGEFDFWLRGVVDGKEVSFTLNFPDGHRRCSAFIEGVCNVNNRELWEMKGKIEKLPNTWVTFERALYDPQTRSGMFVFPLLPEVETEPHPVCGHDVPKGARFCPSCGEDRKDVG